MSTPAPFAGTSSGRRRDGADRPMPAAYQDHPLSGNWNDHRDCHLKPDLVLIYRKPDKLTLQLVRLGSHNELFG